MLTRKRLKQDGPKLATLREAHALAYLLSFVLGEISTLLAA
jgi:hypothetical protein